MTLQEVILTYQELIDKETINLSKLKKQIFRVGSIRLAIVILCIVLCYVLWGNTTFVFGSIIISIILFLFFMKFHNRLFVKRKYCELLIMNAKNELKAINYDFSAFDGATELIDPNHSYSVDLDMFGEHSFFQSINRTVTSYGKEKLANTLLHPFENKSLIVAQQEAIEELAANTELMIRFRAIGQMNSSTEDLDIENFASQFADTSLLSNSFWKVTPYLQPLLMVVMIVLCIINIIPTSLAMIAWLLLIMISLIPAKKLRLKIGKLNKHLEVLDTYSELLKIIETSQFSSPLLISLQKQVVGENMASSAIHKLRYYSDNYEQTFTIIGMLFLNPFLGWCTKYGMKIEKWVFLHKENIPKWFDSIAQFDSLVSFAIFKYTHPDYVFPVVSDTFRFEGKDLGHPMLKRDNCVRNDVNISKKPYFLVVTGANMAGKSTYLRTVGINMILACAGAPVCATSLEFYPYQLLTNLRTSDSLADNESYFFAELKRLKMIIDRLESGEELFIILDEILKGTNSEDKQKGSIALMKQLIAMNGNGIIATHDLVLGNLEQEFPDNVKDYRFEADITNDELTFSYKIREGVAQNMNACFLMRKMGITGL